MQWGFSTWYPWVLPNPEKGDLGSSTKELWIWAWQPTPIFLPGESPWTEEPGGLESTGSQRVGHDWSDWAHTHRKALATELAQSFLQQQSSVVDRFNNKGTLLKNISIFQQNTGTNSALYWASLFIWTHTGWYDCCFCSCSYSASLSTGWFKKSRRSDS